MFKTRNPPIEVCSCCYSCFVKKNKKQSKKPSTKYIYLNRNGDIQEYHDERQVESNEVGHDCINSVPISEDESCLSLIFDEDAVIISDGDLDPTTNVNSLSNNDGINNNKEKEKEKEKEAKTVTQPQKEKGTPEINVADTETALSDLETRQEKHEHEDKNKDTEKEAGNRNEKQAELIAQLPKFVQGLLYGTIDKQVECCHSICEISSSIEDDPFDVLIESGIVPHLIKYLKMDANNDNKHIECISKLQVDAVCILCDISGSSDSKHRQILVSNGVIKPLVNLMLSPNKDVSEKVVWTLGNIAGDSVQHRDKVLSTDVLTNLRHLENRCIDVLNTSTANTRDKKLDVDTDVTQLLQDSNKKNCLESIQLLTGVSWALRKLCFGNPGPDSKYIKDLIEMLNEMLKLSTSDTEILQDVAWGFFFLTDGRDCSNGENNMTPRLMKECGALKRLVDCLGHHDYRVKHGALRALGNIVTGSDEQTQDVLDLGVCEKLVALLDLKQYILCKRNEIGNKNGEKKLNKRGILLKETCWMISNITAGTEDQIDCVIKNNIFPSLIQLSEKAPFEIRKEVAWAISNATGGGSKIQIEYLVDKGVIQPLVSLLESSYPKMLLVAMEGLNNILKCGEDIQHDKESDENEFANMVEAAGGFDKVECDIIYKRG